MCLRLCHDLLYHPPMNIDRIRLLVQAANASKCARDSGVPLRTIMRFRAGHVPSVPTLEALDKWAKGKRLAADVGV